MTIKQTGLSKKDELIQKYLMQLSVLFFGFCEIKHSNGHNNAGTIFFYLGLIFHAEMGVRNPSLTGLSTENKSIRICLRIALYSFAGYQIFLNARSILGVG